MEQMQEDYVDAAQIDYELDESSQKFVDELIDKLMVICDDLSGHPLRPYQIPFARRIFESLITNDGATITALFSRQSGKTEAVANVIATCMIMLPRLAKIYPETLNKYKEGVWVGAFAPVDEQADNLFGRIVDRLTSHTASLVLSDPEIDDFITGRGRMIALGKCGSLVRKTTCHPRATIEGRTYHIILVDECQGADEVVINKSVSPMGTAVNSTMIFTGTPAMHKGVFYETIKSNKRYSVAGRRSTQNHYEVDWKTVGKYNPDYLKRATKERDRLGEDSDEFKLSYRVMWILDKGMFTTSEKLDELGDISMQSVVHAYHKTPVVVGIDCARKQDRTIVTVVFVDWDNPDPFGLYHHRVLNWLDLEGMDWEEQYFRITEFLANYRVWKVGIDIGGLGDTVCQRLQVLNPHIEFVELGSAQSEQTVRWAHLRNLMDRKQISWPAGSKVKRLRKFQRFYQEMEDLESEYKGPYFIAKAPKAANAHDDYPDSLSMACILTKMDYEEAEEAEVYQNILYQRRRR